MGTDFVPRIRVTHPSMNKLILVDRGRDFTDVLRWQFREHPEVEIVCGRFEDLPTYDCVITAGNSFGLMDAGMDLAVVRHFGTHLMSAIQQRILDDYLGEQPVGTSIIVPTGHLNHPFVAHTPTMRAPMNIRGTDHVYVALWAALTAVHRHNRSESRQIHSRLSSPCHFAIMFFMPEVGPQSRVRKGKSAWRKNLLDHGRCASYAPLGMAGKNEPPRNNKKSDNCVSPSVI